MIACPFLSRSLRCDHPPQLPARRAVKLTILQCTSRVEWDSDVRLRYPRRRIFERSDFKACFSSLLAPVGVFMAVLARVHTRACTGVRWEWGVNVGVFREGSSLKVTGPLVSIQTSPPGLNLCVDSSLLLSSLPFSFPNQVYTFP